MISRRQGLALGAAMGATALSRPALAQRAMPNLPATMVWSVYDVGSAGYVEASAISDALGRRPVILAGLLCYIAATLACLFATQIEHLWLARAAQGVSAGVGMVVGRAIIRDVHEGPAAQRLMAQVSMMFAIAPAVGPIVGGLLQEALGWRAVFGFLLAFAVLLWLACWRWLPETLPRERRQNLHPGELARATTRIFGDPVFVATSAAFTLNFAGMFVYVLSAPVFLIEHLGLSAAQFGWLFVPLTAGMMLGAALSGRLAGKLSPRRTVALAYAAMAAAATLNLAISLAAPVGVAWYLLPLPLYTAGMSVAMPSLTLIALDRFPERRGLAAAVQGLMNTGSAGLSAAATELSTGVSSMAACVLRSRAAAGAAVSSSSSGREQRW